MVKKMVLLVLGVLVITLMAATVAVAAHSPQDIYDDFADNGRLDVHYTDAELRAYLDNATLSQYADSSIKDRLDDTVVTMLTNRTGPTDPTDPAKPGRDTFPFTGFQLMIAAIVAVVLVGGGIALRRFSRPERS